MSQEFPVIKNGKVAAVECAWAKERNINGLKSWSALAKKEGNPGKRDAAEYAYDAFKKWMIAKQKKRSVSSLSELKAHIQNNPHAEATFVILAKASWFRSGTPLAFCMIRRTWCNHLYLELLATHPLSHEKISGLGIGLLYQLALLAETLRSPVMWGEATAISATFYEKVFHLESAGVKDLIYVDGPKIEEFKRDFLVASKVNDTRGGCREGSR